ncbi:MAG TPA: hypothetical protein VJL87_03515 [Bdellovibrionota bacterium]|nr:hypothetical protein [Bdellovibrionota bacterium]
MGTQSRWAFLKQFLRDPKHIGALFPSCPALAKMMVGQLKNNQMGVVAEFGPGTGAITPFILERLPKGSTYFAVEFNETFATHLKKRFPSITIVQDSIGNIDLILKKLGAKEIDGIISSIPWASFEEELQDQLLKKLYLALAPHGCFVTFTYLHALLLPSGRRFKKKIKQLFDVQISPVVWKNFPPAIVYRCIKRV